MCPPPPPPVARVVHDDDDDMKADQVSLPLDSLSLTLLFFLIYFIIIIILCSPANDLINAESLILCIKLNDYDYCDGDNA